MVMQVLKKLKLHYIIVELGEIEIMEELTNEENILLQNELRAIGLELTDDKKTILILKIKGAIIEMVNSEKEIKEKNLSVYLSQKLQFDYTYMANLFSEEQGTTIEHFFILLKVEKIKELILYDELNITEISYKLNYSSVSHLSNQFKKITGLTPTHFKQLKDKRRIALENLGN